LSQIFVRLPDAPTVWLVEGELNIARAPTDYINRTRLTDTARDTIRSVTVTRPDADAITVTRAAQGEDFELENIADGMRLKNQFQLNDLVDLFVNLEFEDVTAADEIMWAGDGDLSRHPRSQLSGGGGDGAGDGNGADDSDGGIGLTATMTAFDKSTVAMEQGIDADGESWIRLRAAPPPAAEPADDAGDGDAGDAGDGDAESTGDDASDGGDAGDGGDTATVDNTRADELNKRWSGWAFQLPDFRSETLNRARTELVEPDEADDPGDGDTNGDSNGG